MLIDDAYINAKYKQIKFLGEGGFGKVILAKDKNTNEHFAIKYIDFERLDEDDQDKVIQEGQLLHKFKHENIIRFKEFQNDDYRAIIVMEYVKGGDLDKKIKEQRKIGPFKEEIIISWFLELCNAIKYCHQKHTLHRDLKPLNIFLTKDNHIKLGDFGISKVLRSIKDKTNTKIGSFYYMSPEVLKGEEYSYSCDIWSLGIVLYELCLLKHPLSALEQNLAYIFITEGKLGKIDKNCKKMYSEETCDLIKKILVTNPDERPSIDEIIKECEDILYKLRHKKHYYNNRLYKLSIFNKSSKPEFTKELDKNFGEKPDGKYIIQINDEVKKFHIINGERVYDYTKKNKNEETSKNNCINVIPEKNDESFEDNDELKKTITRITQEGFGLFIKNKKEEPCKVKYDPFFYNLFSNKENNNNSNKKNRGRVCRNSEKKIVKKND